MKTKVFDTKGKNSREVTIPKEIFGLELHSDLIHQVVVSTSSNQRKLIAHTKDRGAVSGGGKKPWRQKGTGRARHGSSRSPIWKGGGVTFGPSTERNFKKKINQKMKAKALLSVLSGKYSDGEILWIDSLSLGDSKTKEAQKIFSALSKNKGFEELGTRKKNKALVFLAERDEKTERAFQNIREVKVEELRKINVLDILKYKYLIFSNPEESFKFLQSKVS